MANDWDKITRVDFSECTLNNSYCLNNLKKFLSDFFTTQCENYSIVHLRVDLLIQSFSFQQHVLMFIYVINVTDDFTFKEWN